MQAEFESRPSVREVSLREETEKRYLNYALSVITSRALPDVRDGMKPVHRRILYGMHHNLKLQPSAKYRKSAAVVGEVMGKYHPHGDQAIYDAMVRMAQSFSLREPLVEGYGNFGSIDGDKAAAMRYTEVRLQPISMELLDELNQDTVEFRDNFDGTQQEPVVLPARFPNLLVNGSAGIAVGMATNIPPHNLGEVMEAALLLLNKPDAEVKDLMRKIKGPDFPTGGELITPRKERIKIYEQGQGNLMIRGEWRELPVKKGKKSKSKTKQVVITSIPYGLNKASLIEKIADVILSRKLPPLVDVRDESTEDIRVVLEVKNNADVDMVMAYLYKHTPLQQRFAVNLTCLVPTPNPQVAAPARLSLKQMLEQFLAFRLEVLERRFECELRKLKRRIHILEGFRMIFNDLDKAIQIIRESDGRKDAAVKLMDYFGLDQEQVDAILDTRLYRLARLEINSIIDELNKLKARAAEIEDILSSQSKLEGVMRGEFEVLVKNFGNKRQTRVREQDNSPEYQEDAFIQDEDTHVVLTREGWIKRLRTIKDVSSIRVREGDEVQAVMPGSTKENVVFFTNMGVAYTSRIWDIPATTGYGQPVQSLFKFKDGEQIVAAYSLDPRLWDDLGQRDEGDVQQESDALEIPAQHLLAATQQGQGLRLSLAPFCDPSNKTGRRYVRLSRGDQVLHACIVTGDEILALASQGRRYLMFPVEQVKFLSGAGKGVRLMQFDEGDCLFGAQVCVSSDEGLTLETERGEEVCIAPVSSSMIAKRLTKGTRKRGVRGWARVIPPPIHIPSLKGDATTGTAKSEDSDASEFDTAGDDAPRPEPGAEPPKRVLLTPPPKPSTDGETEEALANGETGKLFDF